MVQLFIEKNKGQKDWVELELVGDKSLVFSYVRADVEDLTGRNASFSQNIEIPGTVNNRKAFEHVYNLDRYSSSITEIYINKLFNCEYVLEGIHFASQLELNSITFLNETTEVIFNCSIRSQSILIREEIGDKFLRGNLNKADDLDFSAYRHQFIAANVRNSWNTGVGSGYFYPIINYTNYGMTNMVPLMSQRPALYAKEIIDKIFSDAGLTYTSSFLNSNEFKKIIHPWVAKEETDPDELKLREFRAGVTADTDLPGVGPADPTNTKIYSYKGDVPFNDDNEPFPLEFYDNNANYYTSVYRYLVKSGGMYRFSYNLRLTPRFSNPWTSNLYQIVKKGSFSNITASIVVYRNGKRTVLGSNTVKYQPAPGTNMVVTNRKTFEFFDNSINGEITLSLYAKEQQFYVNDEVVVEIEYDNQIYWSNISGQNIKGITLNYRVKRANPNGTAASVWTVQAMQADTIFLGEYINPASGIPENVKQFDYLKSIMNMFNLVIQEDTLVPTNFIIEPRTFVIGTGNTLDWDYKADNGEVMEIERVPTLVGKNLYFKYQEDKDYYNQDYLTYFDTIPYGSYIKKNQEVTDKNYELSVIFSQTPHNWHNTSKVIIPQLYTLDKGGNVTRGIDYKMRILYRTDTNTDTAPFNADFNTYTGGFQPFNIVLFGDPAGPYQQKMRITNAQWFGLSGQTFFYKTGIVPSSCHFEDPYKLNPNCLTFGYQKSYYVPWRGNYPTNNNLYNRFWADYIEDIIDINSRLLTLQVKLSAYDIYTLSFNDVITYSGQKWIINRIDDWTLGELCSVQLLKIIE